jgi:hypothetical protein
MTPLVRILVPNNIFRIREKKRKRWHSTPSIQLRVLDKAPVTLSLEGILVRLYCFVPSPKKKIDRHRDLQAGAGKELQRRHGHMYVSDSFVVGTTPKRLVRVREVDE